MNANVCRKKKIDLLITNLKKSNSSINNLFNILQENFEIILIGGSIRDALNGIYTPRDVDIILKSYKQIELDSILKKQNINYKKNRFSGYKLKFHNMIFDIWTIDNHLAFNSLMYDKKVENIKETTFLNYDSLVYDYTNKKLYVDYYDECQNTKVINIIGNEKYIEQNPFPYINIIKMLKIKKETGYKLSSKSIDYIERFTKKNDDIESLLYSAYEKHYGTFINYKLKKYILSFLNNL